jgi:hypothetical protein
MIPPITVVLIRMIEFPHQTSDHFLSCESVILTLVFSGDISSSDAPGCLIPEFPFARCGLVDGDLVFLGNRIPDTSGPSQARRTRRRTKARQRRINTSRGVEVAPDFTSGGSGGPFLRKAFAAENGTALCGAEGNSCFLAALRAGGSSFHTRITAPITARRGICGEDGYALGFADLAALGLVLELFVEEKQLFPGSKDKVRAAINAGQYLILKFH